MVAILVFFFAHHYLSLFSQSFLMHRYAAHGAFTMNKFWEKFFYLFAYVTMGSSYLSAWAYGVMHRMHHAFADTPKDPHSPKYFNNLFAMMMHTEKIYGGIGNGTIEVEERFKKNVPSWPSFDKWARSWPSRIMWGFVYFAFYFYFAPSIWWYLLLPIHFFMGPVHGAIINWFAHKYGYVNFKSSNTSKNLMPLDIFMLGEGYHNDHHKFPSRINFGVKWYEIDPLYPIILFLNAVGIVKVKNTSYGHVESEF